jgi:acetylornithine deacetylase/succinyl-diaminopimelate desuccinylase-like protein
VPAVTISQRGHVALLVQVDVGGQPVHAGRLGGAVVDPSMALAQVLARMQAAMLAATKTPQRELDPARKSGLAVQSLRNSTIRRLAGGRATRSGSLERRTTAEPAFHVVQLRAGAGRAAVPSRAEARLDVRLPAEADPRAVASHLARVARASAPVGVVVQVTPGAMSPGYAALPRQEVLMAVDDACGAVYGRPLALVRSGGTLPAARLLADSFGLAPVLLGLGTPGGGAHGPDERLDVAGWAQAVRLLVRLLARPIAKATTDDRRGSQRRHSQRQSKTYTMGCPCDNASRQRVWRLYDLPSAAQLDRSLKRPPVGRAAT